MWVQAFEKDRGAALLVACLPPADTLWFRLHPQLCAAESPLHVRHVTPQLDGVYASFTQDVPPLQWAKWAPRVRL